MSRQSLPVLCFLLFSGMLVFFVLRTSTGLPENVATHFGMDGTADGWMPRQVYVTSSMVTGVGAALLVVLVFWIMRLVPGRFFKVANREYWMAPERRGETLDWLQQQGFWMGCLMLVFMGTVHQSILKANASSPPTLNSAGLGLFVAVILGGTLVFVVRLVRRFARVPKEQ